jgi:hypothetical protein
MNAIRACTSVRLVAIIAVAAPIAALVGNTTWH